MDEPMPAGEEHFVSSCDDLMRVISQYVDGDIEPDLCENFEKYMAGCNPCRLVVDNITRTISLYKGEQVYEMPLDCRKRLHDCLREKWKQMHTGDHSARDV